MAELGYCNINSLKLSQASLNAVQEVQSIMQSGNQFTLALTAVPILDIFLGRKNAATQMIDIAGYDWYEFSLLAKSSGDLVRKRIRDVAVPMTWKTHGEEGLFWRCVSGAAL